MLGGESEKEPLIEKCGSLISGSFRDRLEKKFLTASSPSETTDFTASSFDLNASLTASSLPFVRLLIKEYPAV